MKILVTGGAGFIGSNLCKFLLEKNFEVVCLDNLSTGSRNNIKDLLKNKRFSFIEHDIIEPFYVDVDQIYNLACPASPVHYQSNPIRTIKTNTIGIINMLGLAKRLKIKILQASTSEVYGNPLQHPQKETYFGNVNSFGPRSCYDEGKRIAEALMFEYSQQHKVEIRIARIFNTYGPLMSKNDGRVVSNFIVQALENKDITVYGKGQQTRSFCFVADLIDGLYKLMNSDYNKPVNLGNPDEFTILELAEKVIKLTNSKSKIIFKDLPIDDPEKRKPDITLAKNILSWQPKVKLEEGLKETINYFKNLK